MSAETSAGRSSELLSRKGMASPSAGPETRANMVATLDAPADAPWGAPVATPWGDPDTLPLETTRPGLQQEPAPARTTLADWAVHDPAVPAGTRGELKRTRVRVSLRLDEDRHARLKLAATQRNCTLQSLFTEAIDEFFIRHAPDLNGISARLRGGTAVAAHGGETKFGKHNTEGRNGPSRSR